MTRQRILILLLGALFCLVTVGCPTEPSSDCVRIYYDKSKDPEYKLGKIYSIFLQNLLGHFPKYQQIVSPVESYKKGELDLCKANFYIGSYFDNEIPPEFLEDILTTKSRFAWMGYNVWQMSETDFAARSGYKYSHIESLDTKNLDKKGRPTFFKRFSYKGERFEKFGEFVGKDRKFQAGFEIIALEKSELPSNSQVLSTAIHNHTQAERPYVIQNDNFFYIADIPFSFIHEADRYLIFADVLFDILEEEPLHPEKLALVRIEDVHPKTNLPELYDISRVFTEENIPLHISLIPIFFDPLYRYDRSSKEEFLPLTSEKDFMKYLDYAKSHDAEFIWHGVTHQYSRQVNPHTGYTSDDFEFWDAVQNTAIAEDSVDYVIDRLQFGWDFLQKAAIEPVAWLTPHYQASALDYLIFGKVFNWNVGRVIYFDYNTKALSDLPAKTKGIEFKTKSYNAQKQKEYFEGLQVQATGDWNGQLYPYEIYGDYYGQRLIPEILGNPQPFESHHVVYPRSVDEILADAKRNLVLRDCWASMFFHPYLLTDWYNDGIGDSPGDVKPLRKLLKGLKGLGYKFVSLKEFSEQNLNMRKDPIYVEQGDL